MEVTTANVTIFAEFPTAEAAIGWCGARGKAEPVTLGGRFFAVGRAEAARLEHLDTFSYLRGVPAEGRSGYVVTVEIVHDEPVTDEFTNLVDEPAVRAQYEEGADPALDAALHDLAATVMGTDCDCEFYGAVDPDCLIHETASGLIAVRQ